MKLSEQWLREWVNPSVDTQTLIEQLTNAGLEVDGVSPAAAEFNNVVVAEVLEVEPHPDADKLRICQVNDSCGSPIQVVCGAANVVKGIRVPLAQVGASLPNGLKIKKAKLRGVESFGMLCSEQELGMADSADGLLVLPADAPVGEPVDKYLSLDDNIIELDLTPNRGDCLGVMGVARDVAAINDIQLTKSDIDTVPSVIKDVFNIHLDASDDCPSYAGRVIKNITVNAISPIWMQERLRRSGIRSINPVVDVTNYVMLELGQPMHAFDLDKLSGSIHVRKAGNESLVLLDGKEVELDDDILVIADEQRLLAMAGVMGGEGSGVTDSTKDIFLESAFFNPLSIVGRARRFGLHTDSSHRFERGVDPMLQVKAIERATALLIDIVGGQPGPVVHETNQDKLPETPVISFRQERVERMLGIEFSREQLEGYLTSLNMKYEWVDNGWQVKPPSYRFDIAIEADLVEEVARLYGYNQLPESRPLVTQCMIAHREDELTEDSFIDILAQRGWQEAISYSFVDPELQELLSPDRQAVDLSNPISSDMAQMRTSQWTGLIQALAHNQNRQQDQVRLFEVGLNFIAQEQEIDDIQQQAWISGVACGHDLPEHWSGRRQQLDFYDIKGDIEALIQHSRAVGAFSFQADQHAALHPGQAARIYRDEQPVGWLGALHPALEKPLGVTGPVFLFEIQLEALLAAETRCFKPISRFPKIRRDLALVVDENTTAKEIIDCIANIQLETLQEVIIFDLYRGKGVESGRKSAALGLILQDSSRTLTDEEVEEVVSTVVSTLGKNLGGELRD